MTGPESENGRDTSEPALPAWARKADSDPLGDERLAAFIGPRWQTYRRKFAPFMQDPSFVPTWNWSAALATPYWFLYRKLYLPFVLFLLAPGVAARLLMEPDDLPAVTAIGQPGMQQSALISGAFVLSSMIAAGGTGNWLLFRRLRAATRFVEMQQLPESEARTLLARVGGVHRGPTILLVVIALTVMAAQLIAERMA